MCIIMASISLTLSFSNVRLRVCSRNTTVGVARESKLHLGTPSRSLSHACQTVTHCHRLAHPHLVQKTGLYLSQSRALISCHIVILGVSLIFLLNELLYNDVIVESWLFMFKTKVKTIKGQVKTCRSPHCSIRNDVLEISITSTLVRKQTTGVN